ncbi:30S ribosomal protein S3 [Candidatus Pacearchaeota archaeon]|nr:30S ribosomal protein S3 [Candidatus Pacearchaeota archaeon]
MDEKKFVNFKKNELAVKNYIKSDLGKGKISAVNIEYTPVGEKIVIATSRPGQVIGKRGEKIEELTKVLKKGYKLDNPHIDIREIPDARLDAQLVADEIATQMERQGSLKFKIIAYRMLQEIMRAGAMGAEIVLSGRLPSERAKSWRFSQGYLKKTGEPAKVVDRAMAQAVNNMGVSGIKVSILPPNAHIHDRIVVNDALKAKFVMPVEEVVVKKVVKKTTKKKEAKN